MDLPILYPELQESGIPELRRLLGEIIKNKKVPNECRTRECQDSCNNLIRTYFTDKKVSLVPKEQD